MTESKLYIPAGARRDHCVRLMADHVADLYMYCNDADTLKESCFDGSIKGSLMAYMIDVADDIADMALERIVNILAGEEDRVPVKPTIDATDLPPAMYDGDAD